MNKLTEIKLGDNAFAATQLVLKFAPSCYFSDTIFGNLLRFHYAIDPEVLKAIGTVLEKDGKEKPLRLDEIGVLNMVAACDIVRKMFACDAADAVAKKEGLGKWEKIHIERLIDYSNSLINDLKINSGFDYEIDELLKKLDETIQP